MNQDAPAHFNFARDVVEKWGKLTPDALALWCVNDRDASQRRYTFAELSGEVRRAASFFDQLGLRRGDRVLIVSPRVPEWWIAVLGLIRLGVVPVPGTTLLTTRDLVYRVDTAEAVALIMDADGASKADAIEVRHHILLDGARAGWTSFNLAREHGDPGFDPAPTGSHDPGIIYFTSGTTGPPKMVLHTQASYGLGHRITGELWLDLKPSDVHWCITDTGWAKAAWSSLFGPWQMGA